MKKQEFYDGLKEILEIEDYQMTDETNLKELEAYDSLAAIAIISFVDEKFDKKISAEQIRNISTVKSLMELIGLEYFE